MGEDGEAEMAVLVDAEVAGDDGLAVDDPADGEALGNEPPPEFLLDLGFHRLDLAVFDANETRGDEQARRRCQPVDGEQTEDVAGERSVVNAVGEDRVGDELGMHLPFQKAATNRAGIMVGGGRWIRRAVSLEKRDQMRPVEAAVAFGGIVRALDGDENGVAGGSKLGKGPRVQLVGECISARIVFDAVRCHPLLLGGHRLPRWPAGFHPPSTERGAGVPAAPQDALSGCCCGMSG